MSDVVRLLEAAADRLERTGWKSGDEGPAGGPNCLFGALMYAQDDLGMRSLAGLRATAVLDLACAYLAEAIAPTRVRGVDPLARITGWNDNRCGSAQAAVEKLREAAKEAANETGH